MIGGTVLILMGLGLLLSLRKQNSNSAAAVRRLPFVTGIVLTASNPYFLIWWLTVGLALATTALSFGPAGVVLFAFVHWLCDLFWLEVLSLAGFTGSELFGRRSQLVVFAICGVALVGFGIKFIYDASVGMSAALALVSISTAQ